MAHKILQQKSICPYCSEEITLSDLEILNAIKGKTHTLTEDGRVVKPHSCPEKGGENVWIAF